MQFSAVFSGLLAKASSWSKPKLVLLAASLLIAATAEPTPVSLRMAPGDEGARQATGHLVRSILEYTRWPARPDPIRLCVVGPALYRFSSSQFTIGDGRNVAPRALPASDTAAAKSCDALYLGDIGLDRTRAWSTAVRGAAVVTITQADPACASEAMFCLIYGKREMSFEINVDALARSQVRVDPRVLRLAAGN